MEEIFVTKKRSKEMIQEQNQDVEKSERAKTYKKFLKEFTNAEILSRT